MYFWQWNKNMTNVKFHHVRWFQYHFWLQIRFLHVKSPYRTIIKTTKWVIFHEIGWLQYCENTRIYYRELTSIWMNEWIWLGLSIFLSKNRRSTIKLWQRAAFTLLCFGLSTILYWDDMIKLNRYEVQVELHWNASKQIIFQDKYHSNLDQIQSWE